MVAYVSNIHVLLLQYLCRDILQDYVTVLYSELLYTLICIMTDSLADHAAVGTKDFSISIPGIVILYMSSIIAQVQIRYVYEMVYQAMSHYFLHEL